MGVNSLPKTVTRQRRGCDLNTGPSAPESSTLTTQLPVDISRSFGDVLSSQFLGLVLMKRVSILVRTFAVFTQGFAGGSELKCRTFAPRPNPNPNRARFPGTAVTT